MKGLTCVMALAAAAAAFADGDNNLAVMVSTKGPDCYQNGTTVLDGECYALVWSSDGVFDGFTADGSPRDANDRVVNVGAVARNGRCRAVFDVPKSLADTLENGVYSVYLLDTRVLEGGKVSPRGLVDGRLAVLNGYGEISEGVAIKSGEMLSSLCESPGAGKRVSTAAAPAEDVDQPKVTRIVPEGDGIALYVEDMKGYMRVQSGRDLSLSGGVSPAVSTDGSSGEVRIVVPREGSSGFFRVIRSR